MIQLLDCLNTDNFNCKYENGTSFSSVQSGLALALTASAASTNSLESGFLNPPDSARPQTWWHWMNGNVTKEGITADLEAMKQIGLGGATIINVDCGIPAGPVTFNSPEWQDDFKHAVREAGRLGLQLGSGNAPGWSNSGGPWVTPSDSMKQVTTCEVSVTGPTNFNGALPQPPTTLDFYRDIAVLAYPAPDGKAMISNIDAKDCQINRAVLSATNADNSTVGAIQQNKIVDLTSKMAADGKLNWRVPAGNWVILRVGYTSTGVKNHPAPLGGSGLECDKLSPAGMDANWAGFMQKLVENAGPLAGKTFNGSLIDSYEVGGQNWTKNFREEFEKRRGYDPLKFLPAFTGQVVDNPEVSERFLWDVRRTVADLFAENYFGRFAELCREHGVTSEIEPYTGPFESLQSGKPAAEVMGEFWSGSQGERFGQARRLRGAHLRQEHRRRGIVHRESRPRQMAKFPVFAQAARRFDVLRGSEPLHVSSLRDAAVDEPLAGHDDGPMGNSL